MDVFTNQPTTAPTPEPTNVNEDNLLPQRCEELWFEDGSVVIQAENTLFRVHSGVLAAQSEVFRDMFSLPPPADAETYDGCAFVRVSDSAEDMKHLLMVMIKCDFDNIVLNGSHGWEVLRLSSKYMVSHIRNHIISLLRVMLPMHMDDYHLVAKMDSVHFWFSPLRLRNTTLISAANIARETNALKILPIILLQCCKWLTLQEILDGEKICNKLLKLSPENQRAVLLGREKLSIDVMTRVYSVLELTPRISHACLDKDGCEAFRLVVMNRLYELGYTHKWINPFCDFDEAFFCSDEELCKVCKVYYQQLFENAQRKIWDKLPPYFDLPSWNNIHHQS
ncbi:hypothetical protein ABKN59_010543 [Abortiporus biennis]